MEKPASPCFLVDGSKELQCVGRLEIVRPKPLGFLCGSIPIPTEKPVAAAFNSALVPSFPTFSAPRYKELPPSTDINSLPFVTSLPEKVLALDAARSYAGGESRWSGEAMSCNLKKKCEELAVTGLVDFDDEIDVIAPADILKQIFKMPYSKSGLSIAVRRVGQTLILTGGPDFEEGEKLIRRRGKSAKSTDRSLFLAFAMHSVRMEACDCPPNHQKYPNKRRDDQINSKEASRQTVGQCQNAVSDKSTYATIKQEGLMLGCKNANSNIEHHPVTKSTHGPEVPRKSMHESENHNEFLRVFFWQFHNFRMLLGSDMLIFSNEKHVAVSLHLWDITNEVSPLRWLEAWLDNVMVGVPEIAICYHQNGVVHRYELLKTDDILEEATSDDGFPAFNPYTVQQNGLSVLRFLQENCKQDPGAYWLYKNSGEEVIQLFDFSNMPKSSSKDSETGESPLPSVFHGVRSDSLLSLGTLLYRIASRLCHSMTPNSHAKSAKYFSQCLELLVDPDYLVVRAFAHEQFARLLLNYEEQLGLDIESVPLEYEVTVPFESFDASVSGCDPSGSNLDSLLVDTALDTEEKAWCEQPSSDLLREDYGNCGVLYSNLNGVEITNSIGAPLALRSGEPSASLLLQPVADSVSTKLAAVHHVSQAIKSLRWMRQLQDTESGSDGVNSGCSDNPCPMLSPICACGDPYCIEICDIWEWLPTSKIDHKLWKLILLLGESYLALAQAYKDDCHLHEAMRIVDLACSLYGSMPSHFGYATFTSFTKNSCFVQMDDVIEPASRIKDAENYCDGGASFDLKHFTYLFWGKAWALVGDIYVDFFVSKGKDLSVQAEKISSPKELRLSVEIVKEVHRLKNKLNEFSQSCASCSLANCSCHCDRASSGNSASSSGSNQNFISFGRKQGKRSHSKNMLRTVREFSDDERVPYDSETPEICAEIIGKQSDHGADPRNLAQVDEVSTKKAPLFKKRGIFRYIREFSNGDIDDFLNSALCCFKEAQKALRESHASPSDLSESLVKKVGWVCNELGRRHLERKQLRQAEDALAEAVNSFRKASDYTNIILVYCNLGHGRRSLAEEMASTTDKLRLHPTLHGGWKQSLVAAKLEYSESIRYYGLAKSELNSVKEDDDSVLTSLRNEVYTQYAHTYLRLGMLLAKEGGTAKLSESASAEDASFSANRRIKNGARVIEISANDAIREALSVYESLGDTRKQEAAYAYFQLASYQRDCCLKFLESSIIQRVKQYASLAERNWQKSAEFYGPSTHPSMYLSILIEKSSLSMTLSAIVHANAMLEAALSCMLEGRHVASAPDSLLGSEITEKFWRQLQALLKKMVSAVLYGSPSKPTPQPAKPWDSAKLRELYKMSLKSNGLQQLHVMNDLWTRN